MKVLVCGGRDFNDAVRLRQVLDAYHNDIGPFTCVVHGAASGADMLAGDWAKRLGIEVREYPADWKKHGRAAGPIRNAEMLEKEDPDFVIAFPGGRGTQNMVNLAKQDRIRVFEPLREQSGDNREDV